MNNEAASEAQLPPENTPELNPEPVEDFAALLSEFERSHTHKPASGAKQLQGTVVSLSAEQVFLDIGYKTEGVLPRTAFENNAEGVEVGQNIPVSVTGRNEEGYYELSRFKVAQPRDWSALEAAFAEKLAVVGTVTGVIKGGVNVDVGVRAFMPASRSGTRDAAELEKLVGTEINCRITKLDVTNEDVVVDRRVVLEEQARSAAQGRFAAMEEGDAITGTVRSLMSYGAFVDLGGVDGLLHVSDIAWGRVNKPEDVLSIGQEIKVRILKIDPETKKISLGLKQLQAEPWETAPEKFQVGQRVKGTVTRLADFGAFVEIDPGIEGLIHISEMSWGKKVRHPSDILKQGQVVKAQILAIDPEKRQIKLSMKQLIPTSIDEYITEHKPGDVVSGRVVEELEDHATVELGQGIRGTCGAAAAPAAPIGAKAPGAAKKADLSSLTSLLQARWKGDVPAASSKPEPLSPGQIRSFKIVKLDAETKKIELELA